MEENSLPIADLSSALIAVAYAWLISSLLCACAIPLSHRGVAPIDLSLLLAGLTFLCAAIGTANMIVLEGLWQLLPSYAMAVGWGTGFATASMLIFALGQVKYESFHRAWHPHGERAVAGSASETV